MSDTKKYLFIAFVSDEIDGFTQSRHHFYKRMSQLHDVLWISPPRYFKNPKTQTNTQYSSSLLNIDVYRNYIPCDYSLHYNRNKRVVSTIFRMYNDIWMRLNAYLINRRISHYKVDEVVLHIWRPRFKYALDLIKYDKTIYHVDDNYSFSSTIQSRELSKNERELLKQCDFSFIHSKTLFNEQSKLSKNPYLLPNGVDLSLYNDRTYDFDIRAERFDKFDIILGYVGAIKRHLNLPLLLEIANNRKDICIVFVGQIKVNHKEVPEIVTKLQILENVFFEGIVKAEIVPTYLRAFNIGLMPYKQNAYTRNIYPLKMHEYFAAGLPVISTRLENILEFKKSLYFAHTREEYFEIINKVRNQSHEERVNKTKSLIKVARENSWDKRVHTMLEILEYNEEVQ